MQAPLHIQPTAPLAERVLLPGDPGRALLLAQSLLSEPKMFNHNRGLWGYTGDAFADGRPLTIQSTGIGGPSAAIVVAELALLGARTLVRTGTCGALTDRIAVGELLVVTSAVCEDGAGRALGAGPRIDPSPDLLLALRSVAEPAARPAVVISTDLFYDRRPDARAHWIEAGATAVEMETATLFAAGRLRGLRTGAVLLVVGAGERRLEPDARREGEHRLGELAVRALSG